MEKYGREDDGGKKDDLAIRLKLCIYRPRDSSKNKEDNIYLGRKGKIGILEKLRPILKRK